MNKNELISEQYPRIGYLPNTKLDWILIKEIDHLQPATIVQIGSEALTPYLISYCHPQTRFLIFERDQTKYRKLKKFRGSNVEIIRNGIGAIDIVMHHYHVEKIDLIISRYKFGTHSKSNRNKILNNCFDWLSEGGKMIQVQHSNWKVRKSFNSIFQNVQTLWFWENVFPEIGLIGRKSKTLIK